MEDFVETASLSAAWDTSIARTTGFCGVIKNVLIEGHKIWTRHMYVLCTRSVFLLLPGTEYTCVPHTQSFTVVCTIYPAGISPNSTALPQKSRRFGLHTNLYINTLFVSGHMCLRSRSPRWTTRIYE